MADLVRDLRKELRGCKFKRFADGVAATSFGKVYRDHDACCEMLGAMVKFRCRRCCRKQVIEGCPKPDFLCAVHDDAHLKNLRILAKKGPEEFVKGKRNW